MSFQLITYKYYFPHYITHEVHFVYNNSITPHSHVSRCSPSFTGRPGADAVRRVCSAAGKRFDCRQRDVMVASTGVIGVLLDDAKITHRLGDLEHRLDEDGWANVASATMTTDTF